MDCLNCKRALKDTYVVSMGHRLCIGCCRAGVYENEKNTCVECQSRKPKRMLFYCDDTEFRCTACKAVEVQGQCSKCGEIQHEETYVFHNNQIFCISCSSSDVFECFMCGINMTYKDTNTDSEMNILCFLCYPKVRFTEVRCEECSLIMGNYFVHTTTTLCFNCYDCTPAKVCYKMYGNHKLLPTQLDSEEKVLCQVMSEIDLTLWSLTKYISDSSKSLEMRAKRRRAIKEFSQNLRQNYPQVFEQCSLEEFTYYKGTALVIQTLFNKLDEEDFLSCRVEDFGVTWNYMQQVSLLGIWLKIKSIQDRLMEIFFCDRFLYYFDFKCPVAYMFETTLLNLEYHNSSVTKPIPESTKNSIFSVMNTEFVKQKYSEELELDDNYTQILQATLDKTFLCDYSVFGICGVSLMTGNLIIKDYLSAPKDSNSGETPCKKPKYEEDTDLGTASILICFIHEFAHVLARAKLGRGIEFVRLENSPDNFKYNESKKETGFYMEEKLLGEQETRSQVVVEDAASMILDPNSWVDGIDQRFQQLNMDRSNKLSMTLKHTDRPFCGLHE